MLFVLVMAVCGFQVKCSRRRTYPVPIQHVNTSWIGNSSCTISRDSEYRIIVNCQLTTTRDLQQLLPFPDIVYSLDISNNNLTRIEDNVFAHFGGLVNLDLSYNNIQSIERNTLNGLTNLKTLDLSFNSLLTWDTIDTAKHLPSLTELDVTSNPAWFPGRQIASLPRIALLKGVVSYKVRYSYACFYCSLIKNVDKQHNIVRIRFRRPCSMYTYLIVYNFSSIWNLNFSITCEEKSRHTDICKHTRNSNSTYTIIVNNVELCWQEINKWTLPNIPIGLVAMVINFAVMVTVISSVHLRENVAMFFIANMAMGDFLQGLFLVSLTVTRRLMSPAKYFELTMSQNYVCGCLLTLFIMAQCLSVLVGFLVVLERYLCIVYSMNPDIRISKSIAKLLMIVVWLMTIGARSLPLTLIMKLTSDDYSCVNVRTSEGKIFIEYLAMVGVSFYLLSYILYARIFYTVNKSMFNVGIQRESRLAKRIMLVIPTNIFFFLIPLPILSLYINYETFNDQVPLYVLWNTVGYFCLGINSCLNPLLYAFRNDHFRSALKRILKCKRNVVGIVHNN